MAHRTKKGAIRMEFDQRAAVHGVIDGPRCSLLAVRYAAGLGGWCRANAPLLGLGPSAVLWLEQTGQDHAIFRLGLLIDGVEIVMLRISRPYLAAGVELHF